MGQPDWGLTVPSCKSSNFRAAHDKTLRKYLLGHSPATCREPWASSAILLQPASPSSGMDNVRVEISLACSQEENCTKQTIASQGPHTARIARDTLTHFKRYFEQTKKRPVWCWKCCVINLELYKLIMMIAMNDAEMWVWMRAAVHQKIHELAAKYVVVGKVQVLNWWS